MKKESFTYVVSFFLVLFAITLAITYTGNSESLDKYHQVEIQEGDSLWSIADEFNVKSQISKQEFVKWVQDKNGIHSNVVKPGEFVFVPVEKDEIYQIEQIASK
ncbi:cell division suppressor protein YneA [Metabacillus endolithicus]|uniref:LysM peptidoglycan-binding domain-containing protein n=1 Tax=Metabacillus endolithicus TaxID=1535204 RepID=A0ABW5BUY3_9BACI|nr:LysM peptidoglycan-binding domain-containing protein [Metabacillus endolithicus]UPG63335.1 LysM peptidoglycan-binding domain-containing protein [Metabacillus endolithicus]